LGMNYAVKLPEPKPVDGMKVGETQIIYVYATATG
jgi:hypothetical protein